jgi:hypothetical protein
MYASNEISLYIWGRWGPVYELEMFENNDSDTKNNIILKVRFMSVLFTIKKILLISECYSVNILIF